MSTYQGPSDGPQESSAAGESAHGATAVFFDPTGRRRRRHRLLAAIFAFFLVTGVGIYGVQAYQSPEQSTLPLGPDITKEEAGADAPVVGQGPLERVVRVDRSAGLAGLDPFTGVQLTKFTPEQAQAIGDAPYVIERFGYAQNTSHTISLTFDDGPDPVVTPQLLDVLASNHVPATFFVQGRNAVGPRDRPADDARGALRRHPHDDAPGPQRGAGVAGAARTGRHRPGAARPHGARGRHLAHAVHLPRRGARKAVDRALPAGPAHGHHPRDVRLRHQRLGPRRAARRHRRRHPAAGPEFR